MKIILLLFLFFLFNSDIKSVNDTIKTDSNRFKTDIQESVLEFLNDTHCNPDTCYIPFKSEIIE